MSYQTCEDALVTLLDGITGIDARGIGRGDYSVLNLGYPITLVLRYLDFVQEAVGGGGDNNINWGIEIDLYVPYFDDAAVHATATAARGAILLKLAQFPRLNRTANIVDMMALTGNSGGSTPGGPLVNIMIGEASYYHETIRVEVTENADSPFSE